MSPRYVFVGGLHRSGTSLVHRCIRAHPEVTGFSDTGVWEDEGQHLQSRLPTARSLGGPGRFGFHPEAHLTEDSPFATPETRDGLLEDWTPHWSPEGRVRVEKSPPNLLRFRLLQALFPEARFVAVIRHPLAVALSTRQMRRLYRLRSPLGLVHHWAHCHELFEGDRAQLRWLHLVRYEALVAEPEAELSRLFAFLELSPVEAAEPIRRAANLRWEVAWRRWASLSPVRDRLEAFEDRVAPWSYSLGQFGGRGR